MNMVNTTYKPTQDMINKLQSLKGQTKLKFFKNLSNNYIGRKNKKFQTQEDPFAKNAECISKIHHEVILLMTFQQTQPQIKNMNIKYYDLNYTIIRITDENMDIDNQYENDENDYITYNNIVPNLYIRIKKNNDILL